MRAAMACPAADRICAEMKYMHVIRPASSQRGKNEIQGTVTEMQWVWWKIAIA